MRDIAGKYKISSILCIHIMDLGLREYDEAVSLYPALKEYPKEHVQELIDVIKLNANWSTNK